jgi:SulP family sulfate permease
MTVVLVPIVTKFGVSALAPVGLVAGALVVFMGVSRCGGLINKVPWPVMEGFTLGIAIVIALQQLPTALATKNLPGANTLATAWRTLRFAIQSGIHWSSLAVVVLTLVVKFSYPKIRQLSRKNHDGRSVSRPPSLPASFVAIAIASAVVSVAQIKTPVIGTLSRSLYLKHSSAIGTMKVSDLAVAAMEIALLAAIESLLSARVADQMAHIHDPTTGYQPNRELFGQGVATIASSLMGGMPATGAIARTSVNVRSQAKSRIAAITHAIFLLVVVLVLNPVISHVPTAALAAVLLGTSYRIAKPATLKELLRTTRLDA